MCVWVNIRIWGRTFMLYYYVIIIKIKSLTTPINGQSTITNVCTKPLMVASLLDIYRHNKEK